MSSLYSNVSFPFLTNRFARELNSRFIGLSRCLFLENKSKRLLNFSSNRSFCLLQIGQITVPFWNRFWYGLSETLEVDWSEDRNSKVFAKNSDAILEAINLTERKIRNMHETTAKFIELQKEKLIICRIESLNKSSVSTFWKLKDDYLRPWRERHEYSRHATSVYMKNICKKLFKGLS